MSDTPETTIYQLKVVLLGVSPMIWCRILVRNDSTIANLHFILQIVMGWTDIHLHRFRIHGKPCGIDRIGGISFRHDPHKVQLKDFRFRLNEHYLYEYIKGIGTLCLTQINLCMREIKVGFARFYNRRHDRRGYFWGDRFKSVIVENGVTLINCLAYIDLNPLRAGLVERPEQYRWNSIGYHIQTGNEDNFLSLDFGLKEFGVLDGQERLKRYRRYVYEAGSLSRPEKGNIKVIEDKVLEKERSREFKLSKSDRFKYRTRYFTDSGIIGSKEFVSANYQRFKNLFSSKHEKRPKPIKGLEGIYSLKRLSEVI
jgi:hypothetical protein